jgi:hypothetical protein
MAVEAPQLIAGDLVLRVRLGLNTQTGRKEPRFWIDNYNVYRQSGSHATVEEALAEGRQRAEVEGVALWEDVMSRSVSE